MTASGGERSDEALLTEAGAHLRSGGLAEAEAACRIVLERDPRNADAWLLYGRIAEAARQLPHAVEAFRKAIALRPGDAELHFLLANAHRAGGQLDAAVAAYREALRLRPDHSDALLNLGIALANSGRSEEAAQAWEALLAGNPNDVEAMSNLANLYRHLGRSGDSIRLGMRALELSPNNAIILNNLAAAYEKQGRLDEAIAFFRRSLAAQPGSSLTHSNLLLDLSYNGSVTPEELFEEHRRWDEVHAQPVLQQGPPMEYANDRDAERRLRIGYVSPDFRQHPVASFMQPVLANHDRGQVEVFCYSAVIHPDETTRLLQGYADQWRQLVGVRHPQAAEMVQRDRIDILIDLSGHTGGNRLMLFARRPAPIQVTFLGYLGSTGMTAMDYRLSDAISDPPGMTDHLYSEKLLRLPRCAWCFRPPPEACDLGPLPAAANGYVTFGTFNKHPKISSIVKDLWARVMRDVPTSRLMLKSAALADADVCARFIAEMQDRGVAGERITLMGNTATVAEHYAAYNRLDLSLDTWPYNGATTTCDALYMGVPVVALAGRAHESRVGVSMLHAVALEELVAQTPDDYVRIAVALARDTARLAALRAGLRQRVLTSSLMDGPAMARAMEAAYRQMWRIWCGA